MATVQAQADIEQNEYFPTHCTYLQYPAGSVRTLVQTRLNGNPGMCRNDVVNNAVIFLRKENGASPLFCTVRGSTIDANGHRQYTLVDEYENHYTSRLRIKDTVNPTHRAYSILNNMTELQAKRALFDILEVLSQYREDHMRGSVSNTRYRIAFRYRVHAVIAFNRIHVLRVQSGGVGLRADNHMQANAHLLDIMHWFYKTYRMYNQRLSMRARQSYIGKTQKAMVEFILASIALRMGFGPYQKFTRWDARVTSIEDNPAFRGRNIPDSFLSFIGNEFHDLYTEAFKGHSAAARACHVKSKRCTLLQKSANAIYCNDLSDQHLDRITSCSNHMCCPHCRICDVLWHGFETQHLHNAKNILSAPSRPNNFDPTDRMPLLSNEDCDDMMNFTEQLHRIFPNTGNEQQNPWV